MAAAAASSSAGGMVADGGHPSRGRALSLLNESTKFAVSAAAFGALVYFRNEAACWALTGSILNAVAGKILKRALNVPRPGFAPR